jgi:hypothetical protein
MVRRNVVTQALVTLRKKVNQSRDELQRYWREQRGPAARRVLRLRGYAQAVRYHIICFAAEAGFLGIKNDKGDNTQVAQSLKKEGKKSTSSERVFTQIYHRRLWGEVSSASGTGSTLEATALLRAELESLFQELDIRVLVDAPCGDVSWITHVTGGLDYYFGFDIVEPLIVQNLRTCTRTNHFFRTADISRDVLPRADAILCRDGLVHLPSQLVIAAVQNFKKSTSTYLIATTFPTIVTNREVRVGGWRPHNLTAAPYNFPPPMRYLRERHEDANDPYNDKSLGVWRLSDL